MRTSLFFCSFLASCASGKVLELSELQEMTQQLRAGDDRLVRPSPTEATAIAQRAECPFVISSLVETVHASHLPLGARGEAAEVLHLCTTNNPANRADIGTANNGQVFEAIKDLVHTGLAVWNSTIPMMQKKSKKKELRETMKEVGKALAQAAEAVWILSYNNEDNQKGFFEAGMVDELVMTIKSCPVQFDRNGPCSETVMWSFAALQNMAASYCNSESGLCDWQRSEEWNDLRLPPKIKTTTTIDKKVRERIMYYVEKEHFGSLLNYFLCAGPVEEPHGINYSWPGQAKDVHSESHPEIVPWAVAGLMRNLALEKTARQHFSEQNEENAHIFTCLCEMNKKTPDWLEADKSYDALYRLSWDEHCPDIKDQCDDVEGWEEANTGKTCLDYEKEKLCVTMGKLVGKDHGIKADKACCICGGGTPKQPKDVKKKMDPALDAEFRRMLGIKK